MTNCENATLTLQHPFYPINPNHPFSEMTYTVSSGMLNCSIPYQTLTTPQQNLPFLPHSSMKSLLGYTLLRIVPALCQYWHQTVDKRLGNLSNINSSL